MVFSLSARFKSREENGPSDVVVPKVALEQGKLGVIAWREFAPERFGQDITLLDKNCADLRVRALVL